MNTIAKFAPLRTAVILFWITVLSATVKAAPLSLTATSASASYTSFFDPANLTPSIQDSHQSYHTGPANITFTTGNMTYIFDSFGIAVRDGLPTPADTIQITSNNGTDSISLLFHFPSTTFSDALLTTGLNALQDSPLQNANFIQIRFNGILTEELTSFTATAVPEPSSLAIGLLGFGFLLHHRQKG